MADAEHVCVYCHSRFIENNGLDDIGCFAAYAGQFYQPGVGRKTANVIQSVVFNKAAMAVDTHVFRVSHRLGLVSDKCTTPFSVEKELVKHIPETDIPIAHHWLILHGRYVCQARTPQCDTCGLQLMCKYYCQKYKVSKESGKDKE